MGEIVILVVVLTGASILSNMDNKIRVLKYL